MGAHRVPSAIDRQDASSGLSRGRISALAGPGDGRGTAGPLSTNSVAVDPGRALSAPWSRVTSWRTYQPGSLQRDG